MDQEEKAPETSIVTDVIDNPPKEDTSETHEFGDKVAAAPINIQPIVNKISPD